MAKTVLVPIADGSEEIEAVCIIDTLRRAGARVTVASVDGLQVTASRGVKLVADARITECAGQIYGAIALPGGMPGAEHLRDSPELIQMLKEQKQAGRLYAAICASPAVVLQHHQLLEKTRATCFPGMRSKLDPAYASDERVVVDGPCVTSQGPATAIEFALRLVELLFGPTKAQEVGKAMLART
ncbi:MAG: DJ-1/PfpI family protein [Planctomycetes bacterium]|jgi:4-methyl-5(b-hydroxyethyl)-thiazole monophosphate biosynthesis|nr:DJ-1/PfpI family protein [Planctomycetota bacterium]